LIIKRHNSRYPVVSTAFAAKVLFFLLIQRLEALIDFEPVHFLPYFGRK
jgi:hypothetical protein